MSRLLLFALLSTILCGNVQGTEAPKPITRTLLNGLKVAVLPLPDSSVVSVRVLVRAGSINEVGADSGSGLAHYLEHIVASGSTKKRTEAAYREGLAQMGGASNAFTTYDHTGYFINTTPENAELAIQYLSEWMFDSQINEVEFKRERDVITKEMEKSEADVSHVFYEAANRFFYTDHPAGRPIIGYRSNFNAVTSDQVRAFYKTHYVPNNMILVVVGNVDSATVFQKIESSFGKFPTKAVPLSPLFNATLPFSAKAQTIVSTSNVAYVSFRFPTVDLMHSDLGALDLLDNILGSGDQSVLMKKICFDQQLATAIHTASYTPLFTNGYFEITATCKPEQVEALREAVLQVLTTFKSAKLDPKPVEAAKRQKKMDYLSGFDSTDEIASGLSNSILYSGTPDFFQVYTDRMQVVGATEIQQAAIKYLDFDRMVTTVLVGKNQVLNSSNQEAQLAPQPPDEIQLSNGIRVVLMPPDGVARVNVRAYVKGGLRAESWDSNGMGYLLSLLWGKGSKQWNRAALESAFEGRGADLESRFGMRSISLEMTALADDVPSLLPKFADAFWNPAFDANSFEVAKNQQQAVISQREDQWFKQVMARVQSGYYRSHAFSFPLEGTADKADKFTRELILEWHGALMDPGNMVIVVSGGYQKAEVMALIQDHFSKSVEHRSLLQPFRSLNFVPPADSEVVTASLNQPVSVVVVAMKSPTVLDLKPQVVVDALDAVLSGMEYPGGRLHRKLRGETDGLVYMVHAQSLPSPEGGMFFVYALTSPDKAQKVQQLISDELDHLTTILVPEMELKTAISQQKFSYRSQLNALQSRDQVMGTGLVQGVPLAHWTDRIKLADQVTPIDLQIMAKDLFAVRQVYLFNCPDVIPKHKLADAAPILEAAAPVKPTESITPVPLKPVTAPKQSTPNRIPTPNKPLLSPISTKTSSINKVPTLNKIPSQNRIPSPNKIPTNTHKPTPQQAKQSGSLASQWTMAVSKACSGAISRFAQTT